MLQPTTLQFFLVTMFASCRCLADGGSGGTNGVFDEVAAAGSRDDLSERVPVNHNTEVPDVGMQQDDEQSDDEDDTHSIIPEKMRLFQYDPVHTGHVYHIADETGRPIELVTAALDPPIFEIRNFLSSEECDHVIKLALESGLQPSGVIKELLPSLSDGSEDELMEIFEDLDVDIDSHLDPAELADGLMDIAQGLLSVDDVTVLMDELKLDLNLDGYLDFEEFKLTWTPDMERSVNQWVQKRQASSDTSFQFSNTRVSDQTWLDQSWYEDDILVKLQERVVKLMQLPRDIVVSSESLQVVRYQPGGHYHAHYDSTDLDDELICSHAEDMAASPSVHNDDTYPDVEEQEEAAVFDSRMFRLCRFATVLFYLNDVEEGGETAFPVADNETFSYEALEELPYDLYDLTHHCYDSKLVVKPEKGKAILWYNHVVNTTNGWMGDIYNTSLHGGCDVREGEKWIANNWINIDDVYSRQVEYHEFYHRELEIGKQARERERQEKEEESRGEDTTDTNTVKDHDMVMGEPAFDEDRRDEL